MEREVAPHRDAGNRIRAPIFVFVFAKALDLFLDVFLLEMFHPAESSRFFVFDFLGIHWFCRLGIRVCRYEYA